MSQTTKKQSFKASHFVAAVSGVSGYTISRGGVKVKMANGDEVKLLQKFTPPFAKISIFTLADAVQEQTRELTK